MAIETFSFRCPACGIQLTVPVTLAGVVGPCPSCQTRIQAPQPVLYATIVGPPEPAARPMPAVAVAPPPQAPADQRPAVSEAPSQGRVAVAAPRSGPTPVKPAPRQLPVRESPLEVMAKQMPEPASSAPRRRKASHPKHPFLSDRLARTAMLFAFLILSTVLVYGVIKVLNSQIDRSQDGGKRPETAVVPDGASQAATAGGSGADAAPPKAALPAPPADLSLAPPVEALDEDSPGMKALAVLEKFLAAKTLEERLPLMETKTPAEELAESCLAGPLPLVRGVVIDTQQRQRNTVERAINYYYHVDFDTPDNLLEAQTVLVRIRGDGVPKVAADPFLDLFGGRLASYAAEPQEKGGTFQVIIYPLPSCTHPGIRDPEKKLSIKLLARENADHEIARAHFSKVSKIGEMLTGGTHDLSYGQAKPCTVLLRWNTEEDADNPYLEALDITAMDWNP